MRNYDYVKPEEAIDELVKADQALSALGNEEIDVNTQIRAAGVDPQELSDFVASRALASETAKEPSRRERIESFRKQQQTIKRDMVDELTRLAEEEKDCRLMLESLAGEIKQIRSDLAGLGYAEYAEVPAVITEMPSPVRTFEEEKAAVLKVLNNTAGVWLDSPTIKSRAGGVTRPLSALLRNVPKVEHEGWGRGTSYKIQY